MVIGCRKDSWVDEDGLVKRKMVGWRSMVGWRKDGLEVEGMVYRGRMI
jgi:hypothetical protein